MVWFPIFACLTLKVEYSLYFDLTMVKNARYDKIWLTHFWTFWVCYFSAKAELISSFFMSSALRQSLAAWNGLQRGCFQIFLHRICISLLLFLHFPTVYICNLPLLYFYFSLGMERLVENMGKALERICQRMGGGHIHIHNIMASCDAPALIVFCLWSSVLCSHSKSGYNSIPFSLHSYLFKISPATFTKKDVHSQ